MAIIADDVKAILPPESIPRSGDVSWAVKDAQLLVGNVLLESGLDSARMELITKYVAAHFVILNTEKGGIVQERMGDASAMYASSPQMSSNSGLSATRYGRQAMMFDTSGKLTSFNQGASLQAEFRVV
jgi:hypothetical protein